jgi:hypothetical protein
MGSLKGDAKEATGPMMCVQGPPAKIARSLQKDYLRFYRIYKVHKTPNTTEPDKYSQTQPQKV